MKKMFALLMASIFAFAFVSCGGKKTDEASAASKADSIAMADSIAKALEAAEAAARAHADSTAKADSVEATNHWAFYNIYCCGNHNPGHCGTALELENLTKTNGCNHFQNGAGLAPKVDSTKARKVNPK